MTQAYLITPENQTVEAIEIDLGDYLNISRAIGVDYFDIVHLNPYGDVVFVDDEGRLNGRATKDGLFWLTGDAATVELAGKGLVLGTNDEGESIAPTVSLPTVRAMVSFAKPAGFTSPDPHAMVRQFDTPDELKAYIDSHRKGTGTP
jgi:hypothetical protein